jgi:hypothetical protein
VDTYDTRPELPLFERGNTLKPEFRPIYGTLDLGTGDFLPSQESAIAEAKRRRDEGIGHVDLAEGVIWKSKADAAIRFLADTGQTFTADDVRRIAGDPRHPNAMGGRLLAASKSRLIEAVGVNQSTRPEGHARRMTVWRAIWVGRASVA